jgi:hypothetical protein
VSQAGYSPAQEDQTMTDNREYSHPKVSFRLPRETLKDIRTYCAGEGLSLSAVFTLMARGVVEGRIALLARDRQPWEIQK